MYLGLKVIPNSIYVMQSGKGDPKIGKVYVFHENMELFMAGLKNTSYTDLSCHSFLQILHVANVVEITVS